MLWSPLHSHAAEAADALCCVCYTWRAVLCTGDEGDEPARAGSQPVQHRDGHGRDTAAAVAGARGALQPQAARRQAAVAGRLWGADSCRFEQHVAPRRVVRRGGLLSGHTVQGASTPPMWPWLLHGLVRLARNAWFRPWRPDDDALEAYAHTFQRPRPCAGRAAQCTQIACTAAEGDGSHGTLWLVWRHVHNTLMCHVSIRRAIATV